MKIARALDIQSADGAAAAPVTNSDAQRSLSDIRAWLTGYLAFLVNENPENVNTELSFDNHGLDSAAAASLVGDLEDWMGIELDATIVYDYPTVSALADYLAVRQSGQAG